MSRLKKLLFGLLLSAGLFFSALPDLFSQETPVHISASEVYDFIDELASEKIIALNSCIKPYTRSEIISFLIAADSMRHKLSKRQIGQLEDYLFEFTGKNSKIVAKNKPRWRLLPPEFQYFDKKTCLIIRPLYDIKWNVYSNGMPYYQSGGGAELIFNRGIVSAYASLKDHYINREILKKPSYLISEQGGNYKLNEGGREGGDYSEMRGGIFVNWKWGRFGFVKDHISWGDNRFGGLIFQGQNPSTPMLVLHAKPFKWLSFDYIHAWLVSEVIDSSSSYYSKPGWFRGVYQPKYIAANMFTFKPWKNLHVSIGNSILYSDVPVQWVYLIPVLFYKSVDHTINHGIDNQNSQIFLNISSRNIKHLHIYGNLFIDEFSIRRLRDKSSYNFFGFKLGAALSNWPLKNLSAGFESTVIYPMVYKHRVPSLTFTSNQYKLGYYMGDNSIDMNFYVKYSPLAYLFTEFQYQYAVHGNEYEYIINQMLDKHKLIDNMVWKRNMMSLKLTYMPVAGLKIYAEGMYNITKGYDADGLTAEEYLNLFTPRTYQGKSLFFSIGLKLGL